MVNAQTGGFRAGCREQAGLALAIIWRWLNQKPRSVALNVGCLLFAPFITLFVWMVQALFMGTIGAVILAYALVMAALGGGFAREPRSKLSR
jgi:hypothetical protein